MQIIILQALRCRYVQLSVYARFRAKIRGLGAGELEAGDAGFVSKKRENFAIRRRIVFFLKKSFDAGGKILNILVPCRIITG